MAWTDSYTHKCLSAMQKSPLQLVMKMWWTKPFIYQVDDLKKANNITVLITSTIMLHDKRNEIELVVCMS